MDCRLRLAIPALLVCLLGGNGYSQYSNQATVTYGPEEGSTTANPDDYSVSYGDENKYPKDYNYYYYGEEYRQPAPPPPTPTPFMTVEQQVEATKAPIIGYVKPYSDEQYAQIVIQQLNAMNAGEGQLPITMPANVAKKLAARPGASIAPAKPAPVTKENGIPLQSAMVAKVLDRGVMVTSEGLQIRLRGVMFLSAKSTNPTTHEFAIRALNGLKKLTVGRKIYYVVEKPAKGLDGRLLAIVHLGDGTELNTLALESGMGIISPDEFTDQSVADGLIAAEQDARTLKRGFWKN